LDRKARAGQQDKNNGNCGSQLWRVLQAYAPSKRTLTEKHIMDQLSSLRPIRRDGFRAAALAAAFYAASLAFVGAADTDAPAIKKTSDTKIAQTSEVATKKEPVKQKKEEKKKLTGAELYAINCNRCHPERYPTEWNPAQWKTLMLHMRVRANLPAVQAKTIVKYLQEEAGN
jgi:hypothetical protein